MSILEKIYDAGLKFLYPLSPQETYEIIVKEAIKLVNGDAGRLLLEENGELKNVYVSPTYYPLTDPRKKGYTHTSFIKNKAFMINAKQLKRIHPNVSGSGTRSVIFIPMSNRGESYGVLLIRSREDKKFTQREFSILKLFGSLASLAVRKTHSYEETRHALETRDLFISLAAHELRTPLTTINGYIQLLLTKIRNKKPIDSKWVMELALEGKRMEALVNEFLEIDRIKRGKLQYSWSEHSIKKIVQHVVQNFRLNNPARKLVYKNNLSKYGKDTIVADFDKIVEVLTNVLENADKYSPEDKKISLVVGYKSPYFVLNISDQGQGIEKKDLPSIFKGFYKGRKSLHEGMGLGLYLAKSIIDSHKGEVEIKSKVDKGTKVVIKLPRMDKI